MIHIHAIAPTHTWTVEAWKPVLGYEGLYEVSSHGRIRSITRLRKMTRYNRNGSTCDYTMKLKGQALGQFTNKQGRLMVSLCKDGKQKTYYAHRLVLLAFRPTIDDSLECNHRDGVCTNNHLSNLEWMTRQQNMRHSFDTGLHGGHRGTNNPRSKLTPDDVRAIRWERAAMGTPYRTMGKRYGVHEDTIRDIITGKNWSHIAQNGSDMDLDVAAVLARKLADVERIRVVHSTNGWHRFYDPVTGQRLFSARLCAIHERLHKAGIKPWEVLSGH